MNENTTGDVLNNVDTVRDAIKPPSAYKPLPLKILMEELSNIIKDVRFMTADLLGL